MVLIYKKLTTLDDEVRFTSENYALVLDYISTLETVINYVADAHKKTHEEIP